MCVNSCVVTTAYVVLLLAVLACALSYLAPFWILFTKFTGNVAADVSLSKIGDVISGDAGADEILNSLARSYRIEWNDVRTLGVAGLWAACDGDYDNCGWFWQNEFHAEKQLPDWHKATQGLFGGGVILLTIGFILATFHICCRCCKSSFSIGSVIGSFIITGTICVGVGLGVYFGFMFKDENVGFNEDTTMFFWAFYVGVAGFVLAVVSGVLFFCQGCCARDHTGYHMTRVV